MASLRRIPAAAAACALLVALALGAGACSRSSAPRIPGGSRAYRMGFSAIPPRFDQTSAIASLQMWSQRADAAIISVEAPWDSLLAGVPLDAMLRRDPLPLAQYYRSRGFALVVMLDPANGLDRAGEADALVRAGRSLTEPAIQAMFRQFAVVMDTLLQPDYLGTVLETNLIRAASSPALYAAVRQVANDAAADVRARDAGVTLMASVQVETAWGAFGGSGTFQGVAQDFADFPFMQVLGLSSYPYFVTAEPESLPLDYYARIVQGRTIPVIVTEGGWTSADVAGATSTPIEQARYLRRQSQLLAQVDALALFQLTFTDLDLTSFPASVAPFAYLGMVDVDLNPKPALAPWDSLYALPRRGGLLTPAPRLTPTQPVP